LFSQNVPPLLQKIPINIFVCIAYCNFWRFSRRSYWFCL